MTSTADITIRRAGARDADSIARLAALDSTRPPRGHLVLVAEADGELVAAIAADDGHVAADPFVPSADSARRLRTHVDELAGRENAKVRRLVRWARGPVERLPAA